MCTYNNLFTNNSPASDGTVGGGQLYVAIDYSVIFINSIYTCITEIPAGQIRWLFQVETI